MRNLRSTDKWCSSKHYNSIRKIKIATCLALYIRKTHLYNFDPLKPHFYISKLGFTGVYIIFHISAKKHRLWVLIRTASARGGSNEYPQSMFWAEIWKNIRVFCLKIFRFFLVKFSIFLNRCVFVMLDWGLLLSALDVIACNARHRQDDMQWLCNKKRRVTYLYSIEIRTYNLLHCVIRIHLTSLLVFVCVEVYGPVNPMGSCRARSVYLTTRLLGRLSPLSG